jgi:hypothetical protein
MEASDESVWRRALGWLERERDRFALPEGPPDLFRLKALGELAAIVEVLHRQSDLDADTQERLRALLAFAWDQFGRGDVFVTVLDAQPFPVLGTMYSVFERAGWRHEPTRERLARLGQRGGLSRPRDGGARLTSAVNAQYGPDGVIVLCLGLGLAWDVLGLSSIWSRGTLYPRTALARRQPVEALGEPEAYSLTHTVFFMTDWGARDGALPEADRAFLAARVPGWMEDFRAQGQLDLYAELAAVLACVGGAAPQAEAVLRAAQEEDGSIKGPAARAAERTRGVLDPERVRFIGAYHTTLASTLASFAVTVGLRRAEG